MKRHIKRFAARLTAVLMVFAVMALYAHAEKESYSANLQTGKNDDPETIRQFRATWISTVSNLDWPSSKTRDIKDDTERIRKSKDELSALLNKAEELNLNAVFFQVSPEADAFYKSSIVPWSRYLTGTFGKEPGFDPLQYAIDEAHKRGLEIHAWFNPYRVSMNTKETTIETLNVEKSIYMEHPELVKTSGSRFVMDPGSPGSVQWVIDRIMEVVHNYDVDGIHFDDYFYTERFPGELQDEDTFEKYNNNRFSDINDWRRNNTYQLIRSLSEKIRMAKPWVKFGVSPSGVWANKKDGHVDGSNTFTSYTNYEKSFADVRKWVEEELVDYIAPQVYFSFENQRVPYAEVVGWWDKVCKGRNVHLYIGQAFYKINDGTDEYFSGENAIPQFIRQMEFNSVSPGVQGSILFRVRSFFDKNRQEAADVLKSNIWPAKALIPVMPWKGGQAPSPPVQGSIRSASGGANISWYDNDPNTAYYAIYRSTTDKRPDINSKSKKLIALLRKTGNGMQQYIDSIANSKDGTFYTVTCLDRLYNESGGLVISK